MGTEWIVVDRHGIEFFKCNICENILIKYLIKYLIYIYIFILYWKEGVVFLHGTLSVCLNMHVCYVADRTRTHSYDFAQIRKIYLALCVWSIWSNYYIYAAIQTYFDMFGIVAERTRNNLVERRITARAYQRLHSCKMYNIPKSNHIYIIFHWRI